MRHFTNFYRCLGRNARAAIAFLAVALVVVLILGYSSPVAVRSISTRWLYTAKSSCSTLVTIPTSGSGYMKPDTVIFQTCVHGVDGHEAPSCSLLIKGTYGSGYYGEWTHWTLLAIVDTGTQATAIGPPWSRYDYLYLRLRLSTGDTAQISATSKFLADVTPTTLVPYVPPSLPIMITGTCTLDVAHDFFVVHAMNDSYSVWLPRASETDRTVYVFHDVAYVPNFSSMQTGHYVARVRPLPGDALVGAGDIDAVGGWVSVTPYGARCWYATTLSPVPSP